MKFCSKHYDLLVHLTLEDQNEVVSKFIAKVVDPPELQEKIDNRKNQCPVCHFRAEGPKILKEIIKETRQQKKLLEA